MGGSGPSPAVAFCVAVLTAISFFILGYQVGKSPVKSKSTLGERISHACGPKGEIYDWQVKLDANWNPTHIIEVECSAKKPTKYGYFNTYVRAVSTEDSG